MMQNFTLRRMPDVYILDTDFRKIDIIDDYTSLIWSRRYYETGDFELYVNASEKNRELIQLGRFVMRSDDDEIFRIETFEIATSVDGGDFITASGRDLRGILYQRCTLWDWTYGSTEMVRLETIVRQVVYQNFIETASYDNSDGEIDADTLSVYNDPRRKIDHVALGTDKGLTDMVASYEVTVQNIGEWLATICDNYQWGWRLRYEGDHRSDDYELVFDVYKGDDKTSTIIFSEQYENLLESAYTEDRSEYRNSYVLYDDESGVTMSFSRTSGIDRYETTPEEADLDIGVSKIISWENLVAMYGWAWDGGYVNYSYEEDHRGWGWFGFTGYRYLTGLYIWLQGFDFPSYGNSVFDAKVRQSFPDGEERVVNGVTVWHTDTIIPFTENGTSTKLDGWNWDTPEFPDVDPEKPQWDEDTGEFIEGTTDSHQKWSPSDKLTVPTIIQETWMQDNAYGSADIYIRDIEFTGAIEPNTTYTYGVDYELGDLVRVRTKYGITKSARISEVIETFDADGYNLEVNFESED